MAESCERTIKINGHIEIHCMCLTLHIIMCVILYLLFQFFHCKVSSLLISHIPNLEFIENIDINSLHDIQARIATLKYLSRMTGTIPHRTGSKKILVSSLILLPYPSISFPITYQWLPSIILLSVCFQRPRSCGSSPLLHPPILLWPDLLPTPLLHFSKCPSVPCSPHTLSPASSLIHSFPHSQPLIDLPKATTASHHFPFPLLPRLFCWSIRVGEEEREMRAGDSLSPCQVAALRHRGVQHSWPGLEICWTHEKLATPEEGGDPEGRPNVDVVSAQHLANANHAKHWKAGGRRNTPEHLLSCLA